MINNSIYNYSLSYKNRVADLIINLFIDKDDNKIGLLISFFFHAMIFIIALGIPSCFQPKSILVPNIIPIEILHVDDVTRVPEKVVKQEENLVEEKQTKNEERFSSSEQTEIVKQQEKTDEVIEKKSETNEINDIKEEEKIDIPIQEEEPSLEKELVESLPSKKIKPKIKPKPVINPKIESDVVVRIKPKPKKDFSIASVLKDLRNDSVDPASEKEKEEDSNESENEDQNSKSTNFSISEIDLLKQQIYPCWTVPAGAKGAKDMEVKIRIWVNPDKTVNSARILDTNRMQNDPYFRTVAESSLRAILNPACSPLKLPDGKYEIWKKFVFVFELGWMLGN
ncbi:MAG: hypothetical protein CMI98_00600 [Pelagibacteraceae bacterium]|nr:hypothetical protein [Pelagibacteraceae bacterium]